MPFRATFDCLWCGSSHATRSENDLEGWAQLCPECLGKAGDNPFLRFRLRDALAERGAAARGDDGRAAVPAGASSMTGGAVALAEPEARESGTPDLDAEMIAYYEARAGEYDDWYMRRGRYERGPIHDMAWQTDLDAATRWLDDVPIAGRIVEVAAGTGWWSPLLATKGELWCYDAAPGPLERARDRLLAHGLRAHIHLRDAWAEPDAVADAVFAGFWLSHVPRDRLASFLEVVHRWLRPGGTFAFIDSRFDPQSSAVDQRPTADEETSVRRLNDGRTFTIAKVFYASQELEAALLSTGFTAATVTTTSRFFLLGRATS
jgi:SAM-dependent methyltransferase